MTPTQLYRHFDSTGRLLYIGISGDAWKRLQQHLCRSPWRSEFFNMTVETFPTRGAAVDAEAAAILREQPAFNKDGRRAPCARTGPVDPVAEMAKLEAYLASKVAS